MTRNKPPGIGELFKLLFVALAYCLGQNCINAAAAVHVAELGYSAVMSGYMALSFMAFAVVLRLIAGAAADRLSRRLALTAGCALFALSSLMFGLASLPGLLILFRGLQGGGFSVPNSVASTICADLAPEGKLNQRMNLMWGMNAIAAAVSGYAVQAFAGAGNRRGVFYAVSAFLFVAAVVAATLRYERFGKAAKRPAAGISAKGLFHSVIEKESLPAFFVLLLIGLAHAAPAIFIFYYAQTRGFSEITGPYNLAVAAAMAAGNFTGPWLVKKSGHLLPLAAATALFGVSQLALIAGRLASFYFCAVSYGLLIGVTFPILNALGIGGLAFHRRGAGSSTVLLALDFGVGLGSFLFGAMIDTWGFGAVFVTTFGFSVAAAALAFILFGKQNKIQAEV
jgi:MFS family permease